MATTQSPETPSRAEMERLAEVVHKARWPENHQMDITPFADEDRGGREYCFRIARAIVRSLPDARETVAEDIAKWLHDETGHPDSYPNHTWPETERDDGQREGGFVKIVPLHGQAYFRDIARRLVARFALAAPPPSPHPGESREAIIEECAKDRTAESELTKLAAECHRAKWQFDFSDENRLPISQARDMVKRAFGELHRIGDLAMKASAALRALAAARQRGEGARDHAATPWNADFTNAPSEAYEFFLVRPKGIHPGNGKPFHPTIVQRIDGDLYTSDNELDPIYFGQNEADDHPLKTALEWKPLPADWSAVTRPNRNDLAITKDSAP
jgi:hypothetical protein